MQEQFIDDKTGLFDIGVLNWSFRALSGLGSSLKWHVGILGWSGLLSIMLALVVSFLASAPIQNP